MHFLRPWLRSRGWVALRYIRDGGEIPRWFGVAYWDVMERRALLLPIPLNLIVGALRSLRDWAKAGLMPGRIEKALDEAYERGRRDERER